MALPTDDKARKALPIFTFLTRYFPDVWAALTQVCVAGNVQHNPELKPTDIKWAREKSTDQMNTAFRHMLDYGTGTVRDVDGQYHLAKAIWRLCAQLQLDIEKDAGQEQVMSAPQFGTAGPPCKWTCYSEQICGCNECKTKRASRAVQPNTSN